MESLIRLRNLQNKKKHYRNTKSLLVPSVGPSSDLLYALKLQDGADIQGSLLHRETILVIATELASIMNTIQSFIYSSFLCSSQYLSSQRWVGIKCCVNVYIKVNLSRTVAKKSAY